jgi:hypothetical protein
MTVFESAIKALFADPNMAQDASFLPQGGGIAWVRVVMHAPDVFQTVGSSIIETSTRTLEVKVSDCPLIAPGDQFQIGSTLYTVQGEPRRDDLQLTWQVDVYAA